VLVSCSNPSSNGGNLLARRNHLIIIDEGVKKKKNKLGGFGTKLKGGGISTRPFV